jgi:micrococcal nuclease
MTRLFAAAFVALLLTACGRVDTPAPPPAAGDGETATVTRVIDGDTIEVRIDGREERVRYVGVNTPERNEVCYDEATTANANMVAGQTVRLVRDQTNRDRFDRLLRYIYVGDLLVNAQLVARGYAEVVSYPPDNRFFDYFRDLEQDAAAAGRGCHPTGIFDDDTFTR